MTTPFDTRKVRLDLMQELLQVEEKAVHETDVDIACKLLAHIRWIKSKLKFLESPEYRQRKQEGLLE